MKIVVDTNILVSALLNPYGPPASILRLIVEEKVIPCFDIRILTEYREVLCRPRFNFKPAEINAIIEFVQVAGISCTGSDLNLHLTDPDDLPFAETAAAAAAEYLITGNSKHFPKKIKRTKVVTPGEFMEIWLNTSTS